MFAYFNPILLNVEPLTLLWLNAFALNLQRSVKLLSVEQTDPPYLDVKIEAIMFRVRHFCEHYRGEYFAEGRRFAPGQNSYKI